MPKLNTLLKTLLKTLIRWFQASLRLLVFATFGVGVLLSSDNIDAARKTYSKDQIRAGYLYNFFKYVTWPDDYLLRDKNSFIICVVGKINQIKPYEKLSGKIAKDSSVQYVRVTDDQVVDQCHILYLGHMSRTQIVRVLAGVKAKPVLTVGGSHTFIDAGGMIALVQDSGRVVIKINLEVVRESGLVIDENVLDLAQIVKK